MDHFDEAGQASSSSVTARKIFYDLREAKVLIEGWRIHYNTYRPHSSLGYKPPTSVTVLPASCIQPHNGREA